MSDLCVMEDIKYTTLTEKELEEAVHEFFTQKQEEAPTRNVRITCLSQACMDSFDKAVREAAFKVLFLHSLNDTSQKLLTYNEQPWMTRFIHIYTQESKTITEKLKAFYEEAQYCN